MNDAYVLELIEDIRDTLKKAVIRNRFDTILLSGGVDTSIITCLAAGWRPRAVTVSYRGEGADLEYAKAIARFFGLDHKLHVFTFGEALKAVRETIKILKVFDPMEIRNSVPLYVGMRVAREEGAKVIATGDAGDELFAGYPWLFDLPPEEIHKQIVHMTRMWHFSARQIGGSLGLKVVQPFTDPEVVELALRIPPELKVVEVDGRKIGKWVLRKAFEEFLPKDVIWREKAPIEVGSGSTLLATDVASLVSDDEYGRLKEIVKLRDKEHAYYLKTFLEQFEGIPQAKQGEKRCPSCGAPIANNSNFCRMCGEYPV